MSASWWIMNQSRNLKTLASPMRLLGFDLDDDCRFARARIRSCRNARRLGAGTRVQIVGDQRRYCGVIERGSSQDGEYTMVVRLSGA
jgi:hypothetical protein